MSLTDQVIAIFAGTNGYADLVPIENMAAWQADMLKYMETSQPEIAKEIGEKRVITDSNRERMRKALDTFRTTWKA